MKKLTPKRLVKKFGRYWDRLREEKLVYAMDIAERKAISAFADWLWERYAVRKSERQHKQDWKQLQ